MVVGWALHSCKHGALTCSIDHCNPIKRPTERFEERQTYRKKLMSIWMNSVSDDLDMITDWWFFYRMYEAHIVNKDGGNATATWALLVFCVLGTVSYLAELYQTVFKYPDTFKWLGPFTIVFEDVPQILLSLFLSGAFDLADGAELAPLAAFNISTSVYHALMKISGEVFVNYCYCCKFDTTDESGDNYFAEEDVENVKRNN
ncbi:hypothetical protein ACHAXR_006248 [Thalassiosira sp. AJA248-18]